MRYYLVIPLPFLLWIIFCGSAHTQRPAVVKIGAVFSLDSVIGRAAKSAMDAAASDVNSDSSILNGTELRLITMDTECNPLLGAIRTFQVLEKKVVTIIGIQSSTLAHLVSEISHGLQVPLVSFAATDPTLSALQFPFFFRMTGSDSFQMDAIADLIAFYEWRSIIAIFIDDEHGRNGISYLEEKLHTKMSKISHKLPLPSHSPTWDDDITDLLNRSKLYGPRVYFLHLNPDPNLRIFAIAHRLEMITRDYAWIATDWLCTTLDSLAPANRTLLNKILGGVVGLRQYIPPSRRATDFFARWNKIHTTSELNRYGLYAYDSVWAVASSIDRYFKEHGNITFSSNDQLHGNNFGKLKVFDGGNFLRKKLSQTKFTGLTGEVRFNLDQSRDSGSYEIVNINHEMTHRVGYWFNFSGLSVSPTPTYRQNRNQQRLQNVTWPGGVTEKPRGWVIAEKEKPLRIGVPNRASFVEFAAKSKENHKMDGYCVEIFNEALKLVPYDTPHRFEPFGNGSCNPNYDDLVKMVSDNVFDAVVGDITIVTNRTKAVDFTQPYVATGLVIVAPIRNSKSRTWVFLRPFTVELWCAIIASFVVIAVVIWFLEHRVNNHFRGPPKKQLRTMFLFIFSTLFKTNNEDTISVLGRFVMIMWFFLLLVITSSYTASLTSILTVEQLMSPITGIDSLVASRLPIGYQIGSFAYNYLTNSLNIPPSRLISLRSPNEYESFLKKGPANGGVAAIIDELPYVELFLSTHTDFGIIGLPFTKNGWGFGFRRDLPLAVDVSTAILKLSENGKLQEIHTKWLCKMGCVGDRRRDTHPNQLQIHSFLGLYILCAASIAVAVIIYFLQAILRAHCKNPSSRIGRCSNFLCSLFGFKDEEGMHNSVVAAAASQS